MNLSNLCIVGFLCLYMFSCGTSTRGPDTGTFGTGEEESIERIRDLQENIADQPNNLEWRLQLAREYENLGRNMEALKTYENALIIDPNYSDLKYSYAELALKMGDKRIINIIIEFEDRVVSHTAMSMKVQPKHFSLDLGPFHFNLSKNQALMISFLSMLITGISAVYTLLTMDFSDVSAGGLEGLIPGAGSLMFLGTFIVTLLKKGVFPMKHKIAELGSMDKPAIMK